MEFQFSTDNSLILEEQSIRLPLPVFIGMVLVMLPVVIRMFRLLLIEAPAGDGEQPFACLKRVGDRFLTVDRYKGQEVGYGKMCKPPGQGNQLHVLQARRLHVRDVSRMPRSQDLLQVSQRLPHMV